MVPRSRSSLKGSWECLWKHLLQLCQLESLLPKRFLESSGVQDRTREEGKRGEADVPCYHKQTATIKLSTLTTCQLAYFNYSSIRLGEKNKK